MAYLHGYHTLIIWVSSIAQLCLTPCKPVDCSLPGFPAHHQLLELLLRLMPIESVMPSNYLILCHPLFFPPSIFPSIRVFSNESVLYIRWPKYRSFSFSISPSNEYSGLNSFRIDWFDLLAVQETLKNPLQHHSSKTSVLWCSALSMVQLSIHAWLLKKTIALTRWSFVSNVSLLLNMLSRFFHSFSSKEQVSFNFMAAITICSDFWCPRK